jgi:hypothetical protein
MAAGEWSFFVNRWHLICMQQVMSHARILQVFMLACCGFLAACKNSEGSGMMAVDSPDTETTSEAHVRDTIEAGSRDTMIIIHDGEATIKGNLAGNKRPPTYLLPAWKGQTMVAVIKPLKKGGNIRINEIIQPGHISEGPFSNNFKYKFESNGNMRLVMGSDTQSGKRYIGDYYLHITIK